MAEYKDKSISLNEPIRENLILALILLAPKPPNNTPYLLVYFSDIEKVVRVRKREKLNTMAASLQAAATFMQPAKLGVPSRNSLQLRSSQSVAKSFGVEPAQARLTCSLQADFKDLAQKCVDASKIAGFALATSALVVSVCISGCYDCLRS